MSGPLVSILVPCFNAAPYLRATLDSALGQTHPEIEVILVDDGSADDSLAIARSYGPRIRVVTGPQRGASAARDQATQLSRGEFLQYLDADDLLLPGAVASRVAALGDGIGDVACADWQRIAPGGDGTWVAGKVEIADLATVDAEPDLAVFKGFWAPPAALLYRRTLVERIGGWHPGLPVIQDARFMFDAAIHGGRFRHVSGVTAHYRQHASMSLSSRSRTRFWNDVLNNNQEIEREWASRGMLDAARTEAVARAYSMGARVTFPIDRGLYRSNLEQLRRFPDAERSRYLRAAMRLESMVGYRTAAGVMRLLRPKSTA